MTAAAPWKPSWPPRVAARSTTSPSRSSWTACSRPSGAPRPPRARGTGRGRARGTARDRDDRQFVGDGRNLQDRLARRAHRRHRADRRRDRHRQGADRAHDPPQQPARRAAVRCRWTAPPSLRRCSKASCSAPCKGAYTGADRDRIGVFEAANHGTVFLDEIGDIELNFQLKLLRFLQEREIRPLGASRVPSRWTCASSRPPTATCRRWSRKASSARISGSASTWCASPCRRCASAAATFPCWRDFFVAQIQRAL